MSGLCIITVSRERDGEGGESVCIHKYNVKKILSGIGNRSQTQVNGERSRCMVVCAWAGGWCVRGCYTNVFTENIWCRWVLITVV